MAIPHMLELSTPATLWNSSCECACATSAAVAVVKACAKAKRQQDRDAARLPSHKTSTAIYACTLLTSQLAALSPVLSWTRGQGDKAGRKGTRSVSFLELTWPCMPPATCCLMSASSCAPVSCIAPSTRKSGATEEERAFACQVSNCSKMLCSHCSTVQVVRVILSRAIRMTCRMAQDERAASCPSTDG